MDISLIICCYNSETRISATLEHIAKQKIDNLQLEVILVDNNSSDNTAKVAIEVWSKLGYPFCLSILTEPTPGLSYARKKGVLSAKGEMIIFCDDDNWLSEYFIMQGLEIMNSNHEIGVLGGRGIPVFEGEEPDWFSTFQGCYAVGFQAIYSGDITSRGYVWGAGCFIRRQTLLRLYESGFESFCSGRKEGLLLSGDDSEICKWHILIGKKLWYDESLVFKHFIEKHRLQKDYLSRLIQGFNLSTEYLTLYDEVIFYENSSRISKLKIQTRRLIGLLFDYRKYSLKYLKLLQINKFKMNYFKY
jgi:glycosyltransferase involved in cell wall biosynthesis